MVAKKSRFDTRTTLMILFVIVIIAAVYILITNLPAEVNYLSPDEVSRNPQQYLGEKIIVEGYYEADINGGSIVSLPADPLSTPPESLRLDTTNLDNVSLPLYSDIKYHFTGVLSRMDPGSSPVIIYVLVAEKAEIV